MIPFVLSLLLIFAPFQGIGGTAGLGGKAGMGGGAPAAALTFINVVSGCANSGGTNGCVVGTGSAATSSTLNVQVGDKLQGFYKTGGGGNTKTMTDSAGNSFSVSTTPQADANVGNTQMFCAVVTVASATDTVTGSNNHNDNFNDIIVIQTRGGKPSCVIDAQQPPPTLTPTATTSLTTAAFSTTNANDMITLCGGVDSAALTFTAGLIGGVTATLVQTVDGAAACERLIVTTTQSSITAALSVSVSHNWNGQMAAWE